jgi:glycine/D-amino acid oxidase-like deaminating enzyme
MDLGLSTPYWKPPAERYPGRLPEKADVLVVGGGITGVSLLHHLTGRGLSAVLVERDRLASGASGRNAGFLLAGVAENYAAAVRTYGRSQTRDVWALTVENHDRQIEAAAGQEVGHRRGGTLILASEPAEAIELEESAQLLVEDGFEARWDGKALFNPRDGEVNPALLVGALARQAPAGSIREGVEVTAVESGGTVHAGASSCMAGAVVFATNAYTPLVLPQIPIQPTRAQMLATAPLHERVCELPTYSHHGYRYWRQLASGEVLMGGWRDRSMETEVTSVAEPTPGIQAHLDAAVRDLGASVEVTHRWAGTMGFTESGLPIVGPVEGMKNVYVCAGFNGHGMGFAFMSAKRLVDLL